MSTTDFLLNCCIPGDDRIFSVKGPRNDNVSIVKDLIKEENAFRLNDIGERDLWKVCLSINDPNLKKPQSGPPLGVNKKLSLLWDGDPSDEDLHILVEVPSTLSSTLTFNCLLHEDIQDYRRKGFPIKIDTDETVGSSRNAIKEAAMLSLPANSLTLFKLSLPVNDTLGTQLLSLKLDNCKSEPFSAKLSSFFDSALHDHLHILVKQPPGIEPTAGRSESLYTIQEEVKLMSRRETAVEQARKRDPPSTGATNSNLLRTQTDEREDAVYNGRPIQLTAPPLSIYHPVFAKFKRQIAEPIDRATFTGKELQNAHQLIIDSVAFYANEKTRILKIQESLNVLLSLEFLCGIEIPIGERILKPDGIMRCICKRFPAGDTGAYEFTEVENGIGEAHSDPIHQAQCGYVAYYSDKARDRIRNACCCPAFLVGITGPYLMISGAVFTDRFVSQPLEYSFLGGTPYLNDRIYEIAKILRILSSCLLDLRSFYTELPPNTPSAPINPSVFPHFKSFEVKGDQFEIKYLARLAPRHSEKAVFKGSIQHAGREHMVVVKFTPSYCAAAHEISYEANRAPKLWFCDKVETVGLFVVVMDFVEGQTLDVRSTVSQKIIGQLRQALAALHRQGHVYGDLRGPNVVISVDRNGEDSAKLLDFDWGGKEGVAAYPADIKMEVGWHEGICPGGPIRREHDQFMLQRLENGN